MTSSAAQVDLAAKQSGVDAAAVVAWVDQWMETAPLDLVAASARDGLVDALDAMAAAGSKLGVVSDYPAQRKLEALGIADRFDAVVSAQDARVGAFKPNPRGILVALGDLGVRPAEAALRRRPCRRRRAGSGRGRRPMRADRLVATARRRRLRARW